MVQFQLHEEAKIIFKNQIYTYIEIRRKMNIYQSFLNGISSAAIAVERSPELLILLMTMLEVGICFLLLDPNDAKDRLDYMLRDSQIEALITNKKYINRFNHQRIYILEDMLENMIKENQPATPNCSEEHIAYILYTSGSTGRPKGVEIQRSALANFIEGVSKTIPFTPGKRIACLTTVSFDIFLLESVVALCKGLTVVLADEQEQRNPRLMAKLIAEKKVNMLQMTPSRMQLLINYDETLKCMQCVQEIMLGGEVLPPEMLKRLQKYTKSKIYNMYGPTETTIWSCIADLTESEYVNIGYPIQNTYIYILDEKHRIIPDGMVGEIAIGGCGLARGYVNQKELTDKKFIQLKELGKRVYLTGDLGKILSNKALQYIGRIDNQVKIRGYRIELEEIESVLNKHNMIRQSVLAVLDENQSKTLIAFYTSNGEVDEHSLKVYLKEKLPDYMIPSLFVHILEFPLTTNGKIDRKKLIKEFLSTRHSINEILETRNSDISNEIIKMISDLAIGNNHKAITAETTFEQIGINSVTFVKIIIMVEEKYGFEFDEKMLLLSAYPNIQYFIDYVIKKINDQNY